MKHTNDYYDEDDPYVSKSNLLVVTVNLLIFTIQDDLLEIILVKRARDPFVDYWALPGGVVGIKESLEEAAKRILKEKTGVQDVYLEQLYSFGNPNRDPRGRRINVSYFALISSENIQLSPSGTAKEAKWVSIKNLPKLAFDHKDIINLGHERLRSKIGYSNISFGLLRKKFRLSELQKVYEVVLGHKLDKRNFRKKILSLDLIRSTGEKEIDGAHRPAMLYSFMHKDIVLFD